MIQYDRMMLGRQAKELGFVRDTFEKVCRLADVLAFLEHDAAAKDTLALKGGTAINLTIFDLPRLSVDIDMDFSENLPRDAMQKKRATIADHIEKYMTANGYALSQKSKHYHALDSFVYEYLNAGGVRDNLKIEINYILRCHVLEIRRRKVNLPWLNQELTVLSVDPIEIFASKIVALLDRAAPRDLYDLHNMLRLGLFDESEQELLRKCVVFYTSIGTEDTPTDFSYDAIRAIRQNKIKTDLLPVLRNSAFFDVSAAQTECVGYLKELLALTENETKFLQAFREKRYQPELLFDGETLRRVSEHPMAAWKCGDKEISASQVSEAREKPSIMARLRADVERPEKTPDMKKRKKDLER